jgi:hypothetical protein
LATNGSTLVGGVEPPYASFEHPIEQAKQTNEQKNKSVCWFGKQPIGWTQQASKQANNQAFRRYATA